MDAEPIPDLNFQMPPKKKGSQAAQRKKAKSGNPMFRVIMYLSCVRLKFAFTHFISHFTFQAKTEMGSEMGERPFLHSPFH